MARDTRDRILAAAARLFDERGFDGTSIADVLELAGVNSGSLYHFFASKQVLAAAVVERCADRVRDQLETVEAASSDPIDRVLAVVELRRRTIEAGDPDRADPVGLLAAELAGRRPELARLAARYSDRMVGRVREWLDAAGPRLPAETDRDGLAQFVVTVLEGASMRARAERSLEPFDRLKSQLGMLFALLEDAARRGAAVAARAGGQDAGTAMPARPAGDPAGWRSW